jgi:hypothetical protein
MGQASKKILRNNSRQAEQSAVGRRAKNRLKEYPSLLSPSFHFFYIFTTQLSICIGGH